MEVVIPVSLRVLSTFVSTAFWRSDSFLLSGHLLALTYIQRTIYSISKIILFFKLFKNMFCYRGWHSFQIWATACMKKMELISTDTHYRSTSGAARRRAMAPAPMPRSFHFTFLNSCTILLIRHILFSNFLSGFRVVALAGSLYEPHHIWKYCFVGYRPQANFSKDFSKLWYKPIRLRIWESGKNSVLDNVFEKASNASLWYFARTVYKCIQIWRNKKST